MGQFESFIGVNFWTALFILLNTCSIFVVARKFLFTPVHNMIESRQKEIDQLYADAEKAKTDAREPVSYTHLDVYKRQVIDRACIVDEAPTLAKIFGFEMEDIDGHCLDALLKKG